MMCFFIMQTCQPAFMKWSAPALKDNVIYPCENKRAAFRRPV